MGKPIDNPDVATTPSSFGGGWVWPLNEDGVQALMGFFGEECGPIQPLGGQAAFATVAAELQEYDL